MLVRLKSCPGAARVFVEVTGQHFLIVPDENAQPASLTSHALKTLGADSFLLEAPWDREEISNFDAGDLWLESGNLYTLSLIEARILAKTWGAAAVREASLSRIPAGRFAVLLRGELAREFTRVHEEGGTGNRKWYLEDFPHAFERTIAQMGAAVTASQAGTLRASLLRSLSD